MSRGHVVAFEPAHIVRAPVQPLPCRGELYPARHQAPVAATAFPLARLVAHLGVPRQELAVGLQPATQGPPVVQQRFVGEREHLRLARPLAYDQ
ncbi:hypothetical protein [Saccharothrix obliqua]|uniref:hypothetical protein n=1 Tax=Saccharothrix obliqua TaxID=2861747 RepID=UPI001C5D5B08|nr:hypothetical protein [Saccharothrix obliqua]MBW4722309.1 hypothetical protein [Saccharothrix obliqua]